MHRIAPCAPYLPRRASDTNKYDYGRVLIVGGCIGYLRIKKGVIALCGGLLCVCCIATVKLDAQDGGEKQAA